MRVLHVYSSYFPDPPGGVEESIRQIILASSTLGVESRVFTLSPNPLPSKIVRSEALVYRCRSWAAPASCDLGGIESFQVFSELAKWADIINYHFPWPFADLLHLLSSQNTSAVLTYHSDIVRQRLLGRLYLPLMQKLLNSMGAIVATSPAYAKTSPVLTNLINCDRVRVIPLGIEEHSYHKIADNDIIQRFGLHDGIPFFLFIGVLRYYKGLDTLVKAANSVNAKIVIAGSFPKANSLKKQIQQLNGNNVIFTGQVSNSEKVTLFKECLAFVLPSHLRSEAFGMVLVEASLFGKPMVSCEIGTGTSFVNLDGKTGFVVPPKSPEALANAMNKLLDNKSLIKKFGLAARQRYEKKFSGYVLGKAYVKLYSDVLKVQKN